MNENKLLTTIRNARPGTMVDIRLDRDGVGCVDSFEIEKLWELLDVTIPKGTRLVDLYPDGIIVDPLGNIHQP